MVATELSMAMSYNTKVTLKPRLFMGCIMEDKGANKKLRLVLMGAIVMSICNDDDTFSVISLSGGP